MSKRLSILITAIICLCIGSALGYRSGTADADVKLKEYVLDSDANLLTQHVLCLANLRTGRTDAALADIELHAADYIRKLCRHAYDKNGNLSIERMPPRHLSALKAAKLYAAAGYGDTFAKDIPLLLEKIDPVNAIKDSFPAMQELQKQSQKPVPATD